MADTGPDATERSEDAELLEKLRRHRVLSELPDAEVGWLLRNGTIVQYAAGDHVIRSGEMVPGMYVILKGRLSHYRGRPLRKITEWREGDITGLLPYSRLGEARGKTIVDEPSEALVVPREKVAAMPVSCPQLTTILVHVMLDRAREFKTSDLQLEKLASLGRLAAGMAHELNNPASAAARSARMLAEALAESDEASRALGAARLSPEEQESLERVRTICLATPATTVRSPLEQADREESIVDWLAGQGADESFAPTLAETDVKLETLEELAGELTGDKLDAALRWVAAGCTVRALARDIEQASTRVHELVSAVKGFTYMDSGTAAGPVDVRKGLTDTLAVLASKARGKKAAVNVEVAADLPHVRGFGGELNQVWANLIDNALDAVDEGGRVTVTAVQEGTSIVVRVIDDGPGMPDDVKARIFDPFFTTKAVGTGTGLGLDIARRVVTRHKGSITLTSEPGRTEFVVQLPLAGTESA